MLVNYLPVEIHRFSSVASNTGGVGLMVIDCRMMTDSLTMSDAGKVIKISCNYS